MSRPQPNRSPVAIGGMLAAVAVIFALLSQFLPMIFGLFAPLPMVIAVVMLDFKFSVLVSAAASILMAVLLGPVSGLSFFFQYALVGSLMGAFIKAGKNYSTIFLGATVAQAVGFGLFMLAQFALMGFDASAFSNQFMSIEGEMLKNAEKTGLYATLAASSGITASEAELLFRQTLEMVVKLMPSIYCLIFAATAAVSLWMSDYVLKRMQLGVRVNPPQWRSIIMPTWVTAIFIASWIMLLVNNRILDNPLLWIVAVNVMVVGVACMEVDGLSYCLAKLKLSEKSFMWQMFYVMLVLFMGVYIIFVLAFLGVFDAIMDFRHLRE